MGKSRYSNTNVNNEILRNSPEDGAVSSSFSATTISATTFFGDLVDSDVVESTITIESVQFITSGATFDLEVLPTVPSNKYIQLVSGGSIKYNFVSLPFDNATSYRFESNSIGINSSFILPTTSSNEILDSESIFNTPLGGNLHIKIFGINSAPTTGDGNVVIKLRYKILDF